MTIKYNICEKRHEKKMTQKQLAMRAGISTAMVSFIENDKRQPTFLVSVYCKSFKCKIR